MGGSRVPAWLGACGETGIAEQRFLDLLEEALSAPGPGGYAAVVVVIVVGAVGFNASMVRSTLNSSRAM